MTRGATVIPGIRLPDSGMVSEVYLLEIVWDLQTQADVLQAFRSL